MRAFNSRLYIEKLIYNHKTVDGGSNPPTPAKYDNVKQIECATRLISNRLKVI